MVLRGSKLEALPWSKPSGSRVIDHLTTDFSQGSDSDSFSPITDLRVYQSQACALLDAILQVNLPAKSLSSSSLTMFSTKKRKNNAGNQAHDPIHPQESSLRQTVYLVQSSHQYECYRPPEHKTHAVYSTINDANEAARLIFNERSDDWGRPVLESDLAAANAARLETGKHTWAVENKDDEHDFAKDLEFQASGAVSIELRNDREGIEELRVWVATFGVDEHM